MSSGVATAPVQSKPAQLGRFGIKGRIANASVPTGQVQLNVVGLPDSPFAGRAAIATCIAKPSDEELQQRLGALLDNLRAILHPAIVPVLDTGLSGNVAFWICDLPAGQPLPADLTEPMPPCQVRTIVQSIAEGLATAHSRGISHGAITRDAISLIDAGKPQLARLGLSGRGIAEDQRQLAVIAIELLGGKPWIAPEPGEDIDPNLRIPRLRGTLNNMTERVVAVLDRATMVAPNDRFPSIVTFANALSDAITLSADDLVNGAFESISARNPELADLLYRRAREYDPNCAALTVLGIQLHGGSMFQTQAPAPPPAAPPPPPALMPLSEYPISESAPDPSVVSAQPLPPPVVQIPLERAASDQTNNPLAALPRELTEGLPPEYLAALAAQLSAPPVKKSASTMLIMIIGVLVMIGLLLVGVLVTWSIGN